MQKKRKEVSSMTNNIADQAQRRQDLRSNVAASCIAGG